ncbi:pollen-specific leucine-rich repeat extensin-like protein 1 [Diachasma alloeum]|uniref:pollen-specific leucine-rich repeat extensin-like protein 1 n=1 Tax=Diachasma alloeum TaxID=454923 RepID=UPI0007381E47|nr:pollen-specific leucine-rich repeat extensin-like protein 1 [Diachasma alloeum]
MKASRKYNLSEASSSKAVDSPRRYPNPSKTPEDSPKNPLDQTYVNPQKPKKKFRKSFFIQKQRSSIVSPPSSPAPKSPNPKRTTPRTTKQTPRCSMKILNPRNPPKINFDDNSIPQKRKKPSPRGCNSTDDENYPHIEKKAKSLRKKRKLFHLSDSIEDLSEFLEESTERHSEKPEIKKKPRVIHVEYYKSHKPVVPSLQVNNPEDKSSTEVNLTGLYSDLDFLTQANVRSDLNPSPGGRDTSETSTCTQNPLRESENMEESQDGPSDPQKSSLERSETTFENHCRLITNRSLKNDDMMCPKTIITQ